MQLCFWVGPKNDGGMSDRLTVDITLLVQSHNNWQISIMQMSSILKIIVLYEKAFDYTFWSKVNKM